MNYLGVFAAAFAYVWLRAFQQRNVAHASYVWMTPTSFGMAALDMFCIISFARAGWSLKLWLTYGAAGALGSVLAVMFHKRFIHK